MKKGFKVTFITAIVALVMLLSSMTGCVTISPPPAQEPPPVTQTIPPAPINPSWTPPTPSENRTVALPSIADVVALVKPAVVSISTEVVSYDIFNRQFTQEGAGSGWILDPDGIIVTNNHVVEGARNITITLDDGRTFNADVNSVATDSLNDLAIIKIDAHGLPALKRGDTEGLRVGDWVVAIGNALGQGIRATEGIVSRKNVSLAVSQDQTLYDLLETSAAINPGNSGGPLVNLAGEVVGITSAKVAQIGVEGMGYAISINTAIPILQELVTRGYVLRPWLGVSLYTVDQIAIQQLGLTIDKGVLVVRIAAGSPAAQGGMQEGDVIIKMGGQEVDDVEQLIGVLNDAEIGQPLEIVVWRDNGSVTLQVVPVQSPNP